MQTYISLVDEISVTTFVCSFSQSLLDIFSNVLDGRNLDGWVTLQDVSLCTTDALVYM